MVTTLQYKTVDLWRGRKSYYIKKFKFPIQFQKATDKDPQRISNKNGKYIALKMIFTMKLEIKLDNC